VANVLEASDRRALLTQLGISRGLSLLWIPMFTGIMVFVMRWRLVGADRVRREYARLRSESDAPVLVCANHLTMLDSFAITWALGGTGAFLRHFNWLPWNTPEETNFASTWWKRVLVYLLKCVPVKRGSDRAEIAKTLDKVGGGRSRTGRVDQESAAYGVGRLVSSIPGCRVFCVYLRGRNQESWGYSPSPGDVFDVYSHVLEPKTDHEGLRGSVEIAKQIVGQLAEMESRHFDDRQ